MKVSPNGKTRIVDFHGLKIIVPNSECWVAMDKNGDIYKSSEAPTINDNIWINGDGMDYIITVEDAHLEWQDTLVHYTEETRPCMHENNMKIVDYFGLTLCVPRDGYLAMDKDLKIHWFSKAPARSFILESYIAQSYGHFHVCTSSIPGLDWTESCVFVN